MTVCVGELLDADGVIRTAYLPDLSQNNDAAAYARTDRAAIGALGDVLSGSDRPLVVSLSGPAPKPDHNLEHP